MLSRLSRYFKDNVVAFLALFVALGGTGAYAANTIGSSDIIDGEVKSVDVGDNEIKSADVKDESLTTFDVSTFLGADVVDGTLTGADIADNSIGVNDIGSQQVASDEVLNDSLLQSDIRAGAVTNDEVLDNSLIGADIQDNSLTGADINESTLNLPQTPTTGTFASCSGCGGFATDGSFSNFVSKTLPAGSWAVAATANISTASDDNLDDPPLDTVCELRNGSGYIGGATDSRMNTTGVSVKSSLSMNGGAQVPAGGGQVSLNCKRPNGFGAVNYAQMMFIRLDGFS